MTDSQSIPKQQSWNSKLVNSSKFLKKTKLPEKFELWDKRGFELPDKREAAFLALANLHS